MTPILHLPVKRRRFAIAPWLIGVGIGITILWCIPRGAQPVAARHPVVATSQALAGLGRLRLVTISEAHSVDAAVADSVSTDLTHGSEVTVARGSALTIFGWAVDRGARHASSAVFAEIAGHLYPAQVGTVRNDVAVALGSPAYAPSGFHIEIDTTTLPAGRSQVRLYGVDAAGTGRYDFHRTIGVTVSGS